MAKTPKTDSVLHTSSWDEFEKNYGDLVDEAAKANGIPSGLLGRLLWMESRGKSLAVSPKGAEGVAQFMGPTAKEMGIANPKDPKQAIPGAARYLKKIKDQYLKTDDWSKVVAAYNAGPKRVSDGWPLSIPRETRDYVRVVHGSDPWPDRDRDSTGRRPSLEDLISKVPVRFRDAAAATLAAPAVPVTGKGGGLLAEGTTLPQDIGGPLTAGIAPKPEPQVLPLPDEVRSAFQVSSYFPVEQQEANLRNERDAGAIAAAEAKAAITPAEKYDAAVRLTHIIPSAQSAMDIAKAEHLYGPHDWAVTPQKAVEDLMRIGAPAEYAPRLLDAKGPSHYAAIIGAIEQEAQADKVLGTIGFWESLGYGTGAALTDPALAALNFSTLGAPAILRGGSLVSRITRGAAFGAGVGAITELPLQATQETRHYDEAIYAIVGSGLLGGLAGVPGNRELRSLKGAIEDAKTGRYIPKPDASIFPLANPKVEVPAITVTVPKRPVLNNEPTALAGLRAEVDRLIAPREFNLNEKPRPLTVESPGSITVFPLDPAMGGQVDFRADIISRVDLDGVTERATATRLQALGAITQPEPPLRPAPPPKRPTGAVGMALLAARAQKLVKSGPQTVEALQKQIAEAAQKARRDKAFESAELEAAARKQAETLQILSQAREQQLADALREVDEAALGDITTPAAPAPTAAPQSALSIGDAVTWANPKTGAQDAGIVLKLLPDGHALVESAEGGKKMKVPLSALAEEESGGFLAGSVGAAQIKTVDGATLPYGQTTETWSSWGPKLLRFDPVGKLRNLNNPVLSWFSNAGEDGVGLMRDGTGQRASAEEIAVREQVTREVALRRELDVVFSEIDAGLPRWGRAARRKEFEAKLLDYYEFGGLSGNPRQAEYERGMKALQDYFEGWRKRLLDTGVTYAQGLENQRRYIPRIVHVRKFRELIDEVGAGQVSRLIAGALEARYVQTEGRGAFEGLRTAFAAMADGYVRGIQRRGYWGDLIGTHGLPSDRPTLRALLEAAPNMTPERIEEVLGFVEKMGKGDGAKDGPERFKKRFDFDMGFQTTVRGRDGKDRAIRMTDLFVRSASDLAAMYGRQVSGHAALAEHLGIKGRADFEKMKLLAVERHQGSDKELRSGLQLADYLYEGITGRPFEDDPMSAFNVWGRRLRDFNFIRLMNQVGFAQIAEFGRSLSMHGWKAMYQQMPVLKDVFRMAKDGKLDNQLLRELEAMAGIGTHRFRSQLATVSDDTIEGSMGTAVDELFHRAKLLTADISGMSFLTTMQQRMAGAAIAQHLANLALNPQDLVRLPDGTYGPATNRMLQSLGLNEDDWNFVAREIKANAEVGKGGRLHVLNYAQMDPEAANLLALALHRAVRRAVQENSLGNTLPFMHRTTGQLLFQFRGFGMGAIFKQTMQGLAQRDSLTFQAFALTTLLGGLSYVVQTSLNESDPDKLEEKLALDKVAKAGFNRSGYMSMLPTVVDSAVTWGTAGSVPGFFNGRTTPGLGSDLIGGNPSVSLLNNAQRGLAAFPNAMFREDYDYSRADLRAQTSLLPIVGNAIGLRRAWAALGEDLPRESVDTADDYFGAR